MAHYKDLWQSYKKNLEFHGVGYALFEPLAASDLDPPCCGFFDGNHDWNKIAHLIKDTVSKDDSKKTQGGRGGYSPLDREPERLSDFGIEWQPKTSLGVSAHSMDTSANTPNNVPGGADAHIKYQSNSKFGAVLMTRKPVTLHAYNEEALFTRWLEANRALLYARYGAQLKRYGCWIVTRTYKVSGCSINAWLGQSRSALVSLKAKAAMLGELGQGLDVADTVVDKDWSHYKEKTPGEGIVVFMDGIEIKPHIWWLEGMKQTLLGAGDALLSVVKDDENATRDQDKSMTLGQIAKTRSSSKVIKSNSLADLLHGDHRNSETGKDLPGPMKSADEYSHTYQNTPVQEQGVSRQSHETSTNPPRYSTPGHNVDEELRDAKDLAPVLRNRDKFHEASLNSNSNKRHSATSGILPTRSAGGRPLSLVAVDKRTDDVEVLHDAGLLPFGRSASLRKAPSNTFSGASQSRPGSVRSIPASDTGAAVPIGPIKTPTSSVRDSGSMRELRRERRSITDSVGG